VTSIFVTFLRCRSSDYSLPGSVNTLEARTWPYESPVPLASDRWEKSIRNVARPLSIARSQTSGFDLIRYVNVSSFFFFWPMRGACSDRHVTPLSAAGATPKWEDWHPLRMMTR
jgi:hypothetical protein